MQLGNFIYNNPCIRQAFSFQLQTAEPILNLKSLVPGLELQNNLYSFNEAWVGETLEVAQERMAPVSPYIFFMFQSITFRVKSLATSAGLRSLKPLESLFTTSVSVLARGGTIFLANETKLKVPLTILRVRKSSKLQRLQESNLMIAPNDNTELVIFAGSNLSSKIEYYLVPLVYLRRMASEIVVFQSMKFPVESNMKQLEISL